MFKLGYNRPFLTRDAREYSLRVIQTEQEMRDSPLVIEMLNRLATESESDLDKRLRLRGESLKTLHKPKELWQVSEDWLKTSFKGTRFVFVAEEKGIPVCAVIGLVNDPEIRDKMKAPQGSFVYITHAITQEQEKGKGWFGLVLNKIMTSLSNPKRELELPLTYSISVSAASALSKEGEMTYVMNLPLYAQMWQSRFTENKLQLRFQDLECASKQEGRERFDLIDFLNHGLLDEFKVSELIESKKPEAAQEGKWVRGLFLEGQSRSYVENKEFREKVKRERPGVLSKL